MTMPPDIVARSQEVAKYFREDLEQLIKLTGIDLIDIFEIPYGYFQDITNILISLEEDIAHMVLDGHITGMHLIITDNEMDKGTTTYRARYHAHYEIGDLQASNAGVPIRDPLKLPRRVWHGSRFALLVDWNTATQGQHADIRRPAYNFDWMKDDHHYNATRMRGFAESQPSVNNTNPLLVTRSQSTSLEHFPDIPV